MEELTVLIVCVGTVAAMWAYLSRLRKARNNAEFVRQMMDPVRCIVPWQLLDGATLRQIEDDQRERFRNQNAAYHQARRDFEQLGPTCIMRRFGFRTRAT